MRSIGRLILGLVRWGGWRDLLARLPLPMLALAASFGVYSFALLFVPFWVAVVQAAAFELVYIGLAVVKLDAWQERRARSISLGAVVVSMMYNTLDGLFHRRPDLLVAPALWFDLLLALLHGVPLAALAYLVADLLLHSPHAVHSPHKSPQSPKVLPEPSGASGRPPIFTLDGLLESFGDEATMSRDSLLARLGCSDTTLDRLLSDGIAAGRLERLERGVYRRGGE